MRKRETYRTGEMRREGKRGRGKKKKKDNGRVGIVPIKFLPCSAPYSAALLTNHSSFLPFFINIINIITIRSVW